jgi:hypothetical protein
MAVMDFSESCLSSSCECVLSPIIQWYGRNYRKERHTGSQNTLYSVTIGWFLTESKLRCDVELRLRT